jgi:hypothetical protein
VVAGAAGRGLAPLALLALACSSKPRPEDATHAGEPAVAPAATDPTGPEAPASGSATGALAAAPAIASPSSANASARVPMGDLQVRVEWPDVPVAARSSPGRTPCHTPRSPSVAPTTTWGVPGALVIVEGGSRPAAIAHVTLADCALGPRIAIGGGLSITSAVDRPAKVLLRKRGTVEQLVDGDPITVMLPIAGHTVTTPLEAGAIYSLETDDAAPEIAVIATMPGSHVTDASGQITAHQLAVGSHAVTAWLPPRAGQPARMGRGTAHVTDGDLATLTIRLGR